MSFECSSGISEHCAEKDLFDPAYRNPDRSAVCIACAIVDGRHDSRTDKPAFEGIPEDDDA